MSMANQKIYYYNYTYSGGSKHFAARDEFTTAEYTVIAENSINIVIDDFGFTTLSKQKGDYYCLNKAHAWTEFNDSLWGDYISYKLYSTKQLADKTVKKRIENYIRKNVAWLDSAATTVKGGAA